MPSKPRVWSKRLPRCLNGVSLVCGRSALVYLCTPSQVTAKDLFVLRSEVNDGGFRPLEFYKQTQPVERYAANTQILCRQLLGRARLRFVGVGRVDAVDLEVCIGTSTFICIGQYYI